MRGASQDAKEANRRARRGPIDQGTLLLVRSAIVGLTSTVIVPLVPVCSTARRMLDAPVPDTGAATSRTGPNGGDMPFDRDSPALCAPGPAPPGVGIGRGGGMAGSQPPGFGAGSAAGGRASEPFGGRRALRREPEPGVVDEAILISETRVAEPLLSGPGDMRRLRRGCAESRCSAAVARAFAVEPTGPTLEWESTITSDEPGRAMASRTTYESHSRISGDPARARRRRRGTVVTVQLEYLPPLGAVGSTVLERSTVPKASRPGRARQVEADRGNGRRRWESRPAARNG